jgi:hypothetical protein
MGWSLLSVSLLSCSRELIPSLANALCRWALTVCGVICSCCATDRLVAPCVIRLKAPRGVLSTVCGTAAAVRLL